MINPIFLARSACATSASSTTSSTSPSTPSSPWSLKKSGRRPPRRMCPCSISSSLDTSRSWGRGSCLKIRLLLSRLNSFLRWWRRRLRKLMVTLCLLLRIFFVAAFFLLFSDLRGVQFGKGGEGCRLGKRGGWSGQGGNGAKWKGDFKGGGGWLQVVEEGRVGRMIIVEGAK